MEELKNFSTIGIGGKAEVLSPKTEKEFISMLNSCAKPVKVIGNGSNLLFGDCEGITFITTRHMEKKKKLSGTTLYSSASNTLYDIFKFTASHNLAGFERLALIPATIGGAIKNNASCFEHSIFDRLSKIKIYDGKKVRWVKKEKIKFDYHKTNIDGIILSAKFELPSRAECKIRQDYFTYREKRFSSQPVGKSLGSIFKNPPNYSAGKLIEKCGLKGYRIGDAQISQKHANIFLNVGNASFEDMTKLINLTKQVVKEKTKVNLECEIEIISNKKE